MQVFAGPLGNRFAAEQFGIVLFVCALCRKICRPRFGIFAEICKDKIFEVADVVECGVAVCVEVVFLTYGAVVDRHLDFGNYALIRIDFRLEVACHRTGHLRYDYRDDARTRRAQQTGYGQEIAAAERVVGHTGVEPPVRHVADGVNHTPDYVHYGHRRKSAGIVGIPGQEAQYRDHRNGDCHPFEIGTTFAPGGTRFVDNRTHNRVVQSVVNSRKEHKQRNRERTVPYRVRHKHREIRAYDGADEVLSEAAQRISYALFRLHFAVTRISAEKLVPDASLYGRFDGSRAFHGFDFQIFHNTRLTKFCLRIK